jgi:hypothetical protein
MKRFTRKFIAISFLALLALPIGSCRMGIPGACAADLLKQSTAVTIQLGPFVD